MRESLFWRGGRQEQEDVEVEDVHEEDDDAVRVAKTLRDFDKHGKNVIALKGLMLWANPQTPREDVARLFPDSEWIQFNEEGRICALTLKKGVSNSWPAFDHHYVGLSAKYIQQLDHLKFLHLSDFDSVPLTALAKLPRLERLKTAP